MISRLVCLFVGHEYTTIAWYRRTKTWSVRECLRCRHQVRNPPSLRVVIPKVPASYVDPPSTTPERTFR